MFYVSVLEGKNKTLSGELMKKTPYVPVPSERAELVLVGPDWRGDIPDAGRVVLPGSRSGECRRPPLTYGLADADAVTVSSISDRGVMVALRRETVSLSGELLVPGEIMLAPARSTDEVERELAVAAAMMMLGTRAV